MPCTRHGFVDWQWQACSEPAAVSVARIAVSAVSSVADTTQSSFWTPVPKVVAEAMPAMAHTWMVKGSEAGGLGGALGGTLSCTTGPKWPKLCKASWFWSPAGKRAQA